MRVMHVHAQDVMQAGAIRYGQSFSANIEVIRTDMARAEGLFTGDEHFRTFADLRMMSSICTATATQQRLRALTY
jgi:hypothetical protein